MAKHIFLLINYSKENKFFRYNEMSNIFYACPWTLQNFIPKTLLKTWNVNVVNFVIDAIRMGYYVCLNVDRYYLRVTHEKYGHMVHEIFVYGYDIKKKNIYFGDNIANGKYIHAICSFKELEKAYDAVTEKLPSGASGLNTDICLIRLFDNPQFVFNVKQVKYSIALHLASGCTLAANEFTHNIYGIDAILNYANLLEQDFQKNFDVRAFHLFWEHKKVVQSCIQLLVDKNEIEDNGELLIVSKLVQDLHQLMFLSIKANLKNNGDLHTRVVDQLREITLKEKDMLIRIIAKMKTDIIITNNDVVHIYTNN